VASSLVEHGGEFDADARNGIATNSGAIRLGSAGLGRSTSRMHDHQQRGQSRDPRLAPAAGVRDGGRAPATAAAMVKPGRRGGKSPQRPVPRAGSGLYRALSGINKNRAYKWYI